MATVKHIKIYNSDYSSAFDYLTKQHNEFTNKPILDETGHLIERDFYLIDGINCDPNTFDMECEAVNRHFGKNKSRREIKAHHYIVSFDPKDRDDNGLTPEKAQEIGMELARKCFPGHQIIVCTHKDGHNGAGNIHCHIVLNSVRKLTVPREPFMINKFDHLAGMKHHASDAFMRYFKESVMNICQREGLYQVDLLSPAHVRITDKEYWAQRRGQAKLDQENAEKVESGQEPTRTVFETGNAVLRRQIRSVMEDSSSFEEFKDRLLGQYGILVGESRGRINYLPSDRTKPVRGRTLGTDFEKEYIEEYFRSKGETVTKDISVKEPVTVSYESSLIVQLKVIVDEQAKPYAAQSAKIRELKDMAETLAFCQENGINSLEDIDLMLSATLKDHNELKKRHQRTCSELKDAREILRLTKQRHASKKTYLDFMNSTNKAEYRSEHESDIQLYEAADRELKVLLGDKPVPSEKDTIEHIKELSARKNSEYEELSELKRREKALKEIVKNVHSIYEEPKPKNRSKKKEQELE